MPEGTEIPAPVSATVERDLLSRPASSLASIEIRAAVSVICLNATSSTSAACPQTPAGARFSRIRIHWAPVQEQRDEHRDGAIEAQEESHPELYEAPTVTDLGSFGDLTRGGGPNPGDVSGVSQIG
jgi:hypothetical protein